MFLHLYYILIASLRLLLMAVAAVLLVVYTVFLVGVVFAYIPILLLESLVGRKYPLLFHLNDSLMAPTHVLMKFIVDCYES